MASPRMKPEDEEEDEENGEEEPDEEEEGPEEDEGHDDDEDDAAFNKLSGGEKALVRRVLASPAIMEYLRLEVGEENEEGEDSAEGEDALGMGDEMAKKGKNKKLLGARPVHGGPTDSETGNYGRLDMKIPIEDKLFNPEVKIGHGAGPNYREKRVGGGPDVGKTGPYAPHGEREVMSQAKVKRPGRGKHGVNPPARGPGSPGNRVMT